MQQSYGLTIIEFALLLAIMASTAMMVIPFFETSSKGIDVENEASKLELLICNAKDRSIRSGIAHRVFFNPISNSFTVLSNEANAEKHVLSLHLNAGIRIRTANSKKQILSFNCQGIPSQEVEIELSDGREKAFAVKINNPSGRITMERKY